MLYRLLTEDKQEPVITQIVSKYFPGFTLLHGIGFWNGIQESSAIVEVSTDNQTDVMKAAEEIREANNQETVMVESFPITETMVTKPVPCDFMQWYCKERN